MKKKEGKIIIYLIVILLSFLLINSPVFSLTSFETKLYNAAQKEGKLIWWDTLPLKEAMAVMKSFGKKFPDIKVSYFEGTVDVLEEKYLAEHSAGRDQVDFLQIELYKRFRDKGLLLDLSDVIRESGYSKEFCAKDLDAVSLEHTLFGGSYNTKKVPPDMVPRSWEDLLDPKYEGMITVESRLKFFTTITPAWGEEKVENYLTRLRKQNPTFSKGGTHTIMLLSAGEFPIALNMSLHATLRQARKGAPVAFLPIDAADKLSPHVVPRYAPHPNAARLFTYWFISKDGQLVVDQIRRKGNPSPGSGTIQAQTVEKLGIKVHPAKSWELDYKRIQKKYQAAVGFTKDKLQYQKKKKKKKKK